MSLLLLCCLSFFVLESHPVYLNSKQWVTSNLVQYYSKPLYFLKTTRVTSTLFSEKIHMMQIRLCSKAFGIREHYYFAETKLHQLFSSSLQFWQELRPSNITSGHCIWTLSNFLPRNFPHSLFWSKVYKVMSCLWLVLPDGVYFRKITYQNLPSKEISDVYPKLKIFTQHLIKISPC